MRLFVPHVRESVAVQGLAIRSDLPGEPEMEMCILKVQKLWSGLRKRWASCGDTSKEPELQALKDKMRPCYDERRARILSEGPWNGSEASDSQPADTQHQVVPAEPESQFDGPSDSETEIEQTPEKLVDAAGRSSSPLREVEDLDVVMAAKNAKLLGMAGVQIFRQKSTESLDDGSQSECPFALRSPVDEEMESGSPRNQARRIGDQVLIDNSVTLRDLYTLTYCN